MKALVLGGGGFLGTNLTKALLAGGTSVRIFERPGRETKGLIQGEEGMEWFEGDFLNQLDVEESIQGCDVIFHLVSTTLPKGSNDNPAYDVESNVISSIHMMESARLNGIKKIIFVSSGGTVYGIPKQIPISESHPTEPICSYGISKLAIEKYLALFYDNGGPDYTILRLANPYGLYQSPDASQGAIAVFMKKALNVEPVEIWGDGSVVRDYIYVDDVVNAMERSIYYHGDERLFNIGSGCGHSINEILETIEKVLGYHVKRIYTESRKCDVPTNVLDIKRATERLDWAPIISLEEGLRKTSKYLNNI